MEARTDRSIMTSRESSFNIISLQPVPQTMQSVRLAYTADGTAIYNPVTSSFPAPPQLPPTYQGGGGSPGAADAASASASLTAHCLNMNMNMGEPITRKRGRPRKYGPDGLALTSLSMAGPFSPSGMGNIAPSTSTDRVLKKRGRPPGSSNKPKMNALGPVRTSFTPHVITVMEGEDVSSKIMSFFQRRSSRAICILSANGAVSNVTLCQPATSECNVTYEDKFEILSLSASFMLSENGRQRSRTGGLSISLAGPDGRIFGGEVAGLLLAASPVQVIVGSFIPDGKKESKPIDLGEPDSTSGKLVGGGMTGGATCPLPHSALSESSGGSGSPLNRSVGACNNIDPLGLSTIPWKSLSIEK